MSAVLLGEPGLDVRAALAEVGLAVTGVLAEDPFAAEPLVAPGAGTRVHTDLPDLARGVAEGAVRLIVLPAHSPLAAALPEVVALGAAVLLPDPAPWDLDLVRQARSAADAGDVPVAVLLRARHSRWSEAARATVASREKPFQLLVRGWPRGPAAAGELVDLVRAWCGDVLSCSALPAEQPGRTLKTGELISWSMLTETAVTVMVSHEGSLRLSVGYLEPGFVEVGPDVPPGTDLFDLEQDPDPAVLAARALAHALEVGSSDVVGSSLSPFPWVADLSDLQPVARALGALRTSARREQHVRLDEARFGREPWPLSGPSR